MLLLGHCDGADIREQRSAHEQSASGADPQRRSSARSDAGAQQGQRWRRVH